jgi:hypothetical protein
MDLQTRKLKLITYLAQIKDEVFLGKIESYILEQEVEGNPNLKRFTFEEFIQRIEKSERDFESGKFKSQEDLAKLSENW